MRRGELLGLTWRSLDLEGGRLAVEQQLPRALAGDAYADEDFVFCDELGCGSYRDGLATGS